MASSPLSVWDRLVAAASGLVSPDYRWISLPFSAWAVTRVMVAVGFYLAAVLSAHTADPAHNVLLNFWVSWDSHFYLQIAKTGYQYSLYGQSSVAFLPFFSLTIAAFNTVVGDPIVAGLLVTNLSLLGALIFLYRLTELEFGDRAAATRAVFYILAFPSALFFSAIYTESLFLLLVVGTVYFARRRTWGWTAIFAFLCIGTRLNGIAVWPFVLLEWAAAQGWTVTTIFKAAAWQNLFAGLRKDFTAFLLLALAPLSLVSYMAYLQVRFNNATVFITAQAAWGRHIRSIVEIAWNSLIGFSRSDLLAGRVQPLALIDFSVLIIGVLITLAVWRKLGFNYGLFTLLTIVVSTIGGMGSLNRYILVTFPVFMILAWWGRNAFVDRTLMFGLAVLLGVFTTIFVLGIFIA